MVPCLAIIREKFTSVYELFKIFEASKSVCMSVTRWTNSKRRRLNLYVIHHRQNLIVSKNPLQDPTMNADVQVGET